MNIQVRKYEHMIQVPVTEDAAVFIPNKGLEWHLRYGNAEQVRFVAAAIVATFNHLIHECPQKEQTRRLRLMKEAFNAK
jgi:hypothetical protein